MPVTGTNVLAPKVSSRQMGDWTWGLLLVALICFAYSPVGWAGFVWDDGPHLTANPTIVGPLGLKEIWTTQAASICPLVLTTFWFEHALWGLAPLPYHLVNVLMQAACAVALWQLLRKLQIPGAWLGAALWAIHPMQVESVAWITEMKNTQSGLFYLLAIFFFVKWIEPAEKDRTSSRNYALTLLFAALAMTSKTSTVVLPAVLILCAVWLGRWQWRHLLRLLPIFIMSIIAIMVTLWPRNVVVGAISDPHWSRSWPERIAATGDVIWFYLGKLVWPHPLMAIYPRWTIDPGQLVSWFPLLAAVILFIFLGLNRNTWSRASFFAFVYFLIVLSPFLGLIDQSFWPYSFVEDHLQYLAAMGPLALVAADLVRLADRLLPGKQPLQAILAAALLLVLGTASWRYTWVFQNEETLWTDTLAKNPACWLGQNNLGSLFANRGQPSEAAVQFQKAIDLYPNYAQAANNLGSTLLRMGQVDAAIAQYQKAIGLNARDPGYHYNLAVAFVQKGDIHAAETEYLEVIELDPADAKANNNLGTLLAPTNPAEGMTYFQKAALLDPNYAEAHYNLGIEFDQKGALDEAAAQFKKALELEPNNAAYHDNLGAVFAQMGRLDQAIPEFQEALRLKPGDPDAQAKLTRAQAMLQQGIGHK